MKCEQPVATAFTLLLQIWQMVSYVISSFYYPSGQKRTRMSASPPASLMFIPSAPQQNMNERLHLPIIRLIQFLEYFSFIYSRFHWVILNKCLKHRIYFMFNYACWCGACFSLFTGIKYKKQVMGILIKVPLCSWCERWNKISKRRLCYCLSVILSTEGRVHHEICYQYNTVSTKVWLQWTGLNFKTDIQTAILNYTMHYIKEQTLCSFPTWNIF